MDEVEGKKFLEHFEQDQRSTVSNRFLAVIRTGLTDPEEVVRGVREKAQRDLNAPWPPSENRLQLLNRLAAALAAAPEGALRLAEHYLTWNRLPQPERNRRKVECAAVHRREWMKTHPPTAKQLSYLASLGWTGEVPHRLAASELIDRLARRMSP